MGKISTRALIFALMVILLFAIMYVIISLYFLNNNFTAFCISHGYSKTIMLWDHNYCYKLENGTEIIVPIEEIE